MYISYIQYILIYSISLYNISISLKKHTHSQFSVYLSPSSPSIDLLPRRLTLVALAAVVAVARAPPAQHTTHAAALGFPGRTVHGLVLLRRNHQKSAVLLCFIIKNGRFPMENQWLYYISQQKSVVYHQEWWCY